MKKFPGIFFLSGILLKNLTRPLQKVLGVEKKLNLCILVCLGLSSFPGKYKQIEYNNIFKIVLQRPNDIIGLGELHGVRDFYVIKAQLIDTITKTYPTNLYFESGMNELFVLRMKQKEIAKHNLSKYIYFIWHTREIDSLLMVLNQKNDVNIFGIDVQPCNYEFTYYMDSVIKANHLPVYHFRQYDSTLVALSIKSQEFQFKKSDKYYLSSIRDSLTLTYKKCIETFQKSNTIFNPADLKLFSLCMQNRINEIDFIFAQNSDKSNKYVSIRDSLMATNFFLLNALFNPKNSVKSIIWANDGHLVKGPVKPLKNAKDATPHKNRIKFLGEYITEMYGKNYISVGLDCNYVNNTRIGRRRYIKELKTPDSDGWQINLYSSIDSSTRFDYVIIKNRVSKQTYN